MRNPIVLIEIQGGFATAYRSEGVTVSIHDRDTEGNDLGEKHRKANEKSFKALSRQLVRTDGVEPNEALEVFMNPAPDPETDWAAEIDNIRLLSEKAKTWLSALCKEKDIVYTTDHMINVGDEDVELRAIEVRNGSAVYLLNAEMEYISQSGMIYADWVYLAAHIEAEMRRDAQ
jgi:hypothetical protein